MTHPREPEPLRPMLKTAESQLVERMEEVCSHDVRSESTAELMRLEETLSEAAQAAKQAVSLRRRLRTGHGAGGSADMASEGMLSTSLADDRRAVSPDDGLSHPDDDDSAVREFLDRQGATWRVWAVTQEQLHPDRLTADQLGDYRSGWLAFERTDGAERRRFPHYPPNWRRFTNFDLEGLLDRAEAARPSRAKGGDSETTLA